MVNQKNNPPTSWNVAESQIENHRYYSKKIAVERQILRKKKKTAWINEQNMEAPMNTKIKDSNPKEIKQKEANES